MRDQPTRKALCECAEWLKACLDLGWRKEDLDFLEALWWKHHDNAGRLMSPAGLDRCEKHKT